MTNRKFHKTIFQMVVLSEDPLNSNISLNDINYMITEGDYSGQFTCISSSILNGKQIAKELQKQGSNPEFFNLDKNGNELNDEFIELCDGTEGQDRDNYTDTQDRENYTND